jgi:hypothetical protein
LFHKFTQAFRSFASFKSFFFLFGRFFVVAHCCTPKVCSSFLFHKFAQAFYELHNFHRLLCYSIYCTCVQDYSPLKLSSLFWFVFFCSIVACNGNATIVTNHLSSHCFTVIGVLFCELWGWRWNHKVDYTFNSRFHGTWIVGRVRDGQYYLTSLLVFLQCWFVDVKRGWQCSRFETPLGIPISSWLSMKIRGGLNISMSLEKSFCKSQRSCSLWFKSKTEVIGAQFLHVCCCLLVVIAIVYLLLNLFAYLLLQQLFAYYCICLHCLLLQQLFACCYILLLVVVVLVIIGA